MLTPNLVWRLTNMGFTHIYLENSLAPDIQPGDVLTEETRQQASMAVRNSLEIARTGGHLDISQVRKLVVQMIKEILARKDRALSLLTIFRADDHLTTHSVNVAVLSIALAHRLGIPHHELVELGIGALFHDIGKALISRKIMLKPGRLTRSEFAEMKAHAAFGFQILRRVPGIPPAAVKIAHEHHERLDGSGYPRGLRGDEIHPWAQITAVADVYDALISERPYRAALTPKDALSILFSESPKRLNERIVHHLARSVAMYPEGTTVRLTSGHLGVVAEQTSDPERPIVRVVADENGMLPEPLEWDLSAGDTPEIASIVTEPPECPSAEGDAKKISIKST